MANPDISLKADKVSIFSTPSAPQNRFCANGKSAEIHRTTVFSRLDASSLNLFTDNAQVGVSMLGKIFNILTLPS